MAQVESRAVFEPLHNKRNWLRFYIRRYFRIAPAYYLSLGMAFLSADWFPLGYGALRSHMDTGFFTSGDAYDPLRVQYDLPNLLLHLTFLFGLIPHASSSTLLPDWSLSLEMQFYLIFPLLFLVSTRIGWERMVLGIGIPVAILAAAWHYAFRFNWVSIQYAFAEPSFLLFKLQYFLIGMGIYKLAARPVWNSRDNYLSLTLLLILCTLQVGYGGKRVVVILMALGMLTLAFYGQRNNFSCFHWSLVRRLSDSAYSVYLFHGFFISMAGYWFAAEVVSNPWLMLVWVISTTLVWSIVVERWVERPGIELGRRVLRLIPASSAVAERA